MNKQHKLKAQKRAAKSSQQDDDNLDRYRHFQNWLKLFIAIAYYFSYTDAYIQRQDRSHTEDRSCYISKILNQLHALQNTLRQKQRSL